jgi:selenocysteine-specific elongation factor
MYVIGTAGHIDHGKSTLVQALTGIDPDRLREEKERGLTIDLGFAWLKLPVLSEARRKAGAAEGPVLSEARRKAGAAEGPVLSEARRKAGAAEGPVLSAAEGPGGDEVSIVDVPGHERFIKNMLAGVGGIDLALLVIAADEGVMPQTREHLAIIDLLGIERGVVALTKADLVEPGLLELAALDAEEVLLGTTLEGSPVIPCSGISGRGLTELVAAIGEQLAKTPARRDTGRPRLPIDRVFTMAGFGAVVTGTLIDGSLRVGQEVEVAPAGLRTRIRGLQSHGKKTDVAPPGRRTAVNLAGLAVDELRRGMVVTAPGRLQPVTSVDVRVRAVRYLSRPVRHNLQVTFHTGAAEVPGRILLLDRDELTPGETGWAQIRLQQPVAAARGDRFIIRDPNDTLAGGKIVDTNVRRHKRFHEPALAALAALELGSPDELIRAAVSAAEPVEVGEVVERAEIDEADARAAIEGLVEAGELIALGPLSQGTLLWTAPGFDALTRRVTATVAAYHAAAPLRRGIPREELRNRLGLARRGFDRAVGAWASRGLLKEAPGVLALPEHTPTLDAAGKAAADALLAALNANPYSPELEGPAGEELLAHLEDEGRIVRARDGVVFSAAAYREMTERVAAHIREHGSVTLAQVRDMFGTSRKYAQALLEHMDSQHITRRRGDQRVLRR